AEDPRVRDARNLLHRTERGRMCSITPNILENGSMPILSAENQFRQGLVALVDEDPKTAAERFRAAIQIERQRHVRRPQMRYLSYYGLSLALAHGPTQEA